MSFLDWIEQQEDRNRIVKPMCGNKVFLALEPAADVDGKAHVFEWFSTGNRAAGREQGKYETVVSKLSEKFGWVQ